MILPCGHDRHDPTLDHETSPLRVSAQLHAPRRWWATGAGRSPGSRLLRLAPAFPPAARQWHLGRCSPLTVAGAAAAWRRDLAPRSLFTRPRRYRRGREPSRGCDRSKARAQLSTACRCCIARF